MASYPQLRKHAHTKLTSPERQELFSFLVGTKCFRQFGPHIETPPPPTRISKSDFLLPLNQEAQGLHHASHGGHQRPVHNTEFPISAATKNENTGSARKKKKTNNNQRNSKPEVLSHMGFSPKAKEVLGFSRAHEGPFSSTHVTRF